MNRIVEAFMNGQGMSQCEAEETYEALKEDMLAETSITAMDDLMLQYGLELDYVEDLAADLI